MRGQRVLAPIPTLRCFFETQCVLLQAGSVVQRWLWLSKYSPLSSQPCHASLSLFFVLSPLSLPPLGVFADIPTLSVTFLASLCNTAQPIRAAPSDVTRSRPMSGLPVSSFKAHNTTPPFESGPHIRLCARSKDLLLFRDVKELFEP